MFFVDRTLYFKPVKCPFCQVSTLGIYCQGLDMATYELPTSLNSFIAHFGITSLALYESALNHVLGQ